MARPAAGEDRSGCLMIARAMPAYVPRRSSLLQGRRPRPDTSWKPGPSAGLCPDVRQGPRLPPGGERRALHRCAAAGRGPGVGLVRCVLAGRTCRLAFRGSIVQISARMDTTTRRIRRRLEKDGWFLSRRGGAHDIYRHPEIEGIVTLPRHRQVTPAVARSIAKKAGRI